MNEQSPHTDLHASPPGPSHALHTMTEITDDDGTQAALHRAGTRAVHAPLPDHVSRRLHDLIDAGAIASAPPPDAPSRPLAFTTSPARRWPAVAAVAAGLALASSIVLFARYRAAAERASSLAVQLAHAQEQVDVNQRLIAAAREQIELHDVEVRALKDAELAAAQQLADATAAFARAQRELDEATLKIATLEAPIDPATLQQNRTKLLEVPGTIRLAWSPFNVDGAPPAEQAGVQGDVVWNDELQTGYLRFVGLAPNDPAREQYQVWVIDERGLEQKVSGGVFNANAAGEVIVPIRPGIDVGRVALFAVTVENPGGTWVPDLRRRVVIAPRG